MVHIVNHGITAAAIQQLLVKALGPQAVAPISELRSMQAGDLVIVAADDDRLDLLQHWEGVAGTWTVSLFCVHVHGGEAIIGPELRPNQPGCLQCWSTRYYSGRARARQFGGLAVSRRGGRYPDPWISDTTAALIAEITVQRVEEILADPHRDVRRSSKVYSLDLRTLTGAEWGFLPYSSCSRCAQLPHDSAAKAKLVLKSRPKSDPDADRVTGLGKLQSVIHENYVGRGGIVSGVSTAWRFHPGAVALTGVDLADTGVLEPCSGHSDRYSSARTVAVLEALERYTSAMPRNRRVAVRGSVKALGDLVVNPRSFGLYSDQQYAENADQLAPYSDDLEMDFVWAHSFSRNMPVLVPRHLGFYSPVGPGSESTFVIEGSNGCAVGSCPEEALYHGLLEVIERDAFLLTWYARITPPRLDLNGLSDVESRCRIRLLEAQGFAVTAFDITTDFGVPGVWLIAQRCDRQMPCAICTAAAHSRPERAIKKAIRELCSMVNRFQIEAKDPELRQRADRLAGDFSLVRSILDHPLCFCSPAAQHYFDFLFESKEQISIAEFDERSRHLWSSDMRVELENLLAAVRSKGWEILAVEHTAPEQELAGLCTYKVLVPGALPIAWGAHLQRFEGMPRFQAVLRNGAANPAPHPFT